MTPPVDQRARIEDMLAQALASRGAAVGYAVQLNNFADPAQPPQPGWIIVVTMRNPELDKGDLYVPTSIVALTVDRATVVRICGESLKLLDGRADKVRRALMAGPNGKGPGQ